MIIRKKSAGDGSNSETEVVLDKAEMALLVLTFNPKVSPSDALASVDTLLTLVERQA